MPTTFASLAAAVSVMVLIAVLVGFIGRAWRQRWRQQRRERAMEALALDIAEYFRLSGAEVNVECIAKPDGQTLFALIDSEPQPRFRYSHLIEIGLRAHLQRRFGVELTRVYWRFALRQVSGIDPAAIESGRANVPSPNAPPANAAPANTPPARGEDREVEEDSYLNQRRMREKLAQEYEVGHASWESFEAARDRSDRLKR